MRRPVLDSPIGWFSLQGPFQFPSGSGVASHSISPPASRGSCIALSGSRRAPQLGNRTHQGSLGMSSRTRSFGAFAGGSFTKMVCVLLAGLIIISGQSLILGASPAQAETGTPWIQSDKDDYPPGGLVSLTGGDWQPGESVHLYVNDDQGRTWERNSDVVADDTGAVLESFNLPDWF